MKNMPNSYIGIDFDLTMVNFHTAKKINAPVSEVWKILSDIDREPEFWHGTKSIKNITKSDKVVEREVVIAFKEHHLHHETLKKLKEFMIAMKDKSAPSLD